MAVQFIRAEDGSYIQVKNVTRLCVETSYDDKSTIRAHHNGPSMPFTIAKFETSREAHVWLVDLVDRLEAGSTQLGVPRRRERDLLGHRLTDVEPAKDRL